MFNLETHRVTNTRDIKWTNKLYGKGIISSKEQSEYYTASEEETKEETIDLENKSPELCRS